MAQYEYRTLLLEQVEGKDGRRFRWHCHGGTGMCEHRDVADLLNAYGKDGWRVIAQDTDGRLGGTVILERQLPDEDAPPAAAPATAQKRRHGQAMTLASPHDYRLSEALLTEVRALREQVAAQAPPVVNVPEYLPPTVNLDGLQETLRPVLEELRSLRHTPPSPPSVVIDRSAFAEIEATLRETLSAANAAPATAVLNPDAMRWVEGTLAGALERAAARRDDEPPQGPPVAVLDEASIGRLQSSLQSAAAALPVPHVQASAVVDETALEPLQATIAAAVREVADLRAEAVIDAASIARLEAAVRSGLAQVAPMSAVIAPEVVASLTEALVALPVPQVQATAVLSPEATADLRAALAEAVKSLPQPVAEVAVTTILADEAVARLEGAVLRAVAAVKPAPVTVTLEAEALLRLERVVASLEMALAPKLIAPVEEPKPEPNRWWWPKASGRLRWSFGR